MVDPKPGDLISVKTGGFFAKVIRGAQWIDDHSTDAWKYNHAAVHIADGKIIEARPTGVGYGSLSEYSDYLVIPLEGDPVLAITEAEKHLGKPYGFLDLIALAVSILGYRPKWVERICLDTKTVVCSQLDAFSAYAAGDRRWLEPFWITPADIAKERTNVKEIEPTK